MYKENELETILIKILNDNSNQWFSKTKLYNYLIKTNNTEFFIGYYLFTWEKLLINDNFIIKTQNGNNILIKIKFGEENDDYDIPDVQKACDEIGATNLITWKSKKKLAVLIND